MSDENLNELICAILYQACFDYQRALCGHGYDRKHHRYVIQECESFFRSHWFEQLTDLDPEYLINILRGKRRVRKL